MFSGSAFGAAYKKVKKSVERGLIAVGTSLSQAEVIAALEEWIADNMASLGLAKYKNLGEKPHVIINGIKKQIVDGVSFAIPSTPKDKGMQIVWDLEEVENPDPEILYKLVVDTLLHPRGIYHYDNGWHRVATNILACKSLKFVQDFLGFIEYEHTHIDYVYANNYFKAKFASGNHGPLPSCSAVKNGNFFGKNNDWYYDNNAEFIVKTNHTGNKNASMGVASAIGINNEILKEMRYSDLYEILPFYMTDGFNEKGVGVAALVAPTDKGATKQEVAGKEEMCAIMIPRYVLDNFDTAREAANAIKNFNIYGVPNNELHFLIGDKTESFAVEFINNETKVTELDRPYMANFHVDGVETKTEGGIEMLDWDTVEPHGSGLERYEKIMRDYSSANTKNGMRTLLRELDYTNAYKDTTSPFWKTEFVGDYGDPYGDITIDSTDEEFAPVIEKAKENFAERSRDTGKTWHSTHNVVYDLDSLTMYITVQEEDEEDVKVYSLADTNYVAGQNVEIEGNTIKSMPILIVDSLPATGDQKLLYKVSGINGVYWYNGTEFVDITSLSGMIAVTTFPTGADIKESFLYRLTQDITHQETPEGSTTPITVIDYYAGVYVYINGAWKALWSRVSTVSYANVTEKPKINNHEVDGEHAASDYGILDEEAVRAEFQTKDLSKTLEGLESDNVEDALEELSRKVGVTFKPKGNVDYKTDLPTTSQNGDVYVVRYTEDPDEPTSFVETFTSFWWSEDSNKYELFGTAVDMSAYQKLIERIDKLRTANPTISFDSGSKVCVNDNFAIIKALGTLNTPVGDIQSADRAVIVIPPELGITDGEIWGRITTKAGQFTALENVSALTSLSHRLYDYAFAIKDSEIITINEGEEDEKKGVLQDFTRNGNRADILWDNVNHTIPSIKTSCENKKISAGETVQFYRLKTNPEPTIIGNRQETKTDYTGQSVTINIPIWEVELVTVTGDENYMKLCDYADSGLNINEQGVYGYYSIAEASNSKLISTHEPMIGKKHGFAGTVTFTPANNTAKKQALNVAYIKTDTDGVQRLYIQGDVTVSQIFLHTLG